VNRRQNIISKLTFVLPQSCSISITTCVRSVTLPVSPSPQALL